MVQVCAQAMCLEEMLHIAIPQGEIYYNEIRRRVQIDLSETLRSDVKKMAADMHNMYSRCYTPKPVKQKNCKSCSLVDLCMPKLADYAADVRKYIAQHIRDGDK